MDLDQNTSDAGNAVATRPARGLSRRALIRAGAAAGGGLLLSIGLRMPDAAAADASGFAPNAFVRIDRDGRVTLIVCQVEMGQGTYSSMPMLIAEELEVDLAQAHVEHAPPDDKLYFNPLLGFQATGGSTSVPGFWEPLRRAGATARTMLVAAAADSWKVDANSCRAEKGEVVHVPTGRKLGYGALADKAATLTAPAADKVVLKDPRDFKLIGTPAKRLDTPDKVNGKAEFGIDVKIPGMKIATVAACPVIGGKLARLDDSKAKSVKGVRQIVRLDNAVAVVADHMGAAKKGLAALDITWDGGANARFSSADLVSALDEASKRPGVVAKQAGDVAKAMAGAARTIEAVYQQPLLAHATMEPINCTVHVRPDGCDVWVGTQVISRAQATAAQVTGLPPEKVRVHNHLLGGGFGRRLDVDSITDATSRAIGSTDLASAKARSATIIAAAPLFRPGALPAVIVPSSRNAGRSLASTSNVVSGRGASSATNASIPFLPRISTAMISSLNLPAFWAALKRCCERSAKRSCAARESCAWVTRSSVCQPECLPEKASSRPSRSMLSWISAGPMR